MSPKTTKADTPKFEASFPIPTIKATKDGLHVHGNAEEDESESTEVFFAEMDLTNKTGSLRGFGVTTAEVESYAAPSHLQQGEYSQCCIYDVFMHSWITKDTGNTSILTLLASKNI